MKPRVLVLTGGYLPGWKAGGPVRSLVNMVAALGGEFDFRIVTRDRDLNDTEPYAGVPRDVWVGVDGAQVFYGKPRTLNGLGLARVVKGAAPDLVVLTGFFGRLSVGYLSLRRLRLVPRTPVVILAQGQFGQGAIALKKRKKQFFVLAARASRLVSGVEWQGTTEGESEQIKRVFPGTSPHVASDVPARPEPPGRPPISKSPGAADFVFISRISAMKNLSYTLDVLGELTGDVTFTIYGPKEPGEWDRLEPIVDALPDHVRVVYGGILRPHEVKGALERSHFFTLSTLGENFGHAIYESLCAGRPVVISDRTPWRDLEREHAGWDIPLEARAVWVETLQHCVDMDAASYQTLTNGAYAFAERWFKGSNLSSQQSSVFNQILAS